ncbi:MAG: hypothetical protein C3F02_04225 [Parcubacteria group bacterium]|nr:MAG: hypothetical protein C3F02_04225 [Parcubacteria group bacterium]
MSRSNLLLTLFIIVAVLAARLWPHAPNFSPLASLLLFSGAYHSKRVFLFFPLLALLISDFIIGFYAWPIMLSVYGSLALTGLIGLCLKNKVSFIGVANASLGSAVLFFLLTNGAVWFFGTWYSHDLGGLLQCFTLAVPFFRNTVLSNLFYSIILFTAYDYVRHWHDRRYKKLALSK